MRWTVVRWGAFATFAATMGALSLLRWETHHSRSLDMAYYVRLVWGLAHGRWDNPVVGAEHLLGLHLEPVLLPFAALARLGLPIPETLLVAQAVLAAAAIFPAAALARRHLTPTVGEAWAHLAASSIYLVPTVTRCVDYDVHPTTMVVAPLLAFVAALDGRRWRAALAWGAASLAFREDVGLMLACAGATLLAVPTVPAVERRAERATALVLVAGGVLWFGVYALAIQPGWLPDQATGAYGAHFDAFGGGRGGVGGVLAAALADPLGLARYLLSEDRLTYALVLLLPVALLPLAAPRWLAGALPVFAINLLSDYPGVRTVQAHYATTIAPFVVAAGIVGAGRLARAWPRGRLAPVAALVAAATVSWWLRGASPGSPEWRAASYADDEYARRARAIVAGVPPGASVTAPSRILAHLAERAAVVHPRYAPEGLDVVIEERDGLPVRVR